ncbi:hypothetical protein OQA88_4520 [Cercophora sp. LCS_1]
MSWLFSWIPGPWRHPEDDNYKPPAKAPTGRYNNSTWDNYDSSYMIRGSEGESYRDTMMKGELNRYRSLLRPVYPDPDPHAPLATSSYRSPATRAAPKGGVPKVEEKIIEDKDDSSAANKEPQPESELESESKPEPSEDEAPRGALSEKQGER